MHMYYCMKNGSLEMAAAGTIIGAAVSANLALCLRDLFQEEQPTTAAAVEGAALGATIAALGFVCAPHTRAMDGEFVVRSTTLQLLIAPSAAATVAVVANKVRKFLRLKWIELAAICGSVALGNLIGQKCVRALHDGANPVAAAVAGAATVVGASVVTCALTDAAVDFFWTPSNKSRTMCWMFRLVSPPAAAAATDDGDAADGDATAAAADFAYV